MSLYDGPRDTIAHIAELERRFSKPFHDHQSCPKTGWRAERERARFLGMDMPRKPR